MPPSADWLVKPLKWTTKTLSQSLKDWFELLDLPRPPVFAPKTTFPNQEGRLIRVLLFCTACVSIALGTDHDHTFSLAKISPQQMQWLIWIVAGALLYLAIATLIFRISLRPRQAVFVFALTLLPYAPIIAVIHILGDNWPVGSIFLIAFWIVVLRTFWSLTVGISVVSGSPKWLCLTSLAAPMMLGAGLWLINPNLAGGH